MLLHDPNQASCTNSQHTADGIFIHTLPDEEKAPERRKKWVRFVRKICFDRTLHLRAHRFFALRISSNRYLR